MGYEGLECFLYDTLGPSNSGGDKFILEAASESAFDRSTQRHVRYWACDALKIQRLFMFCSTSFIINFQAGWMVDRIDSYSISRSLMWLDLEGSEIG